MYQTSAILAPQSSSRTIISQLIQQLELSGLHVMRSFDLDIARSAHWNCTCSYHGTEKCDCQMVVLLVYGQDGPPVTLVVHGHDGQIQVALVNTPEQRPVPQLVNAIERSILTDW